MPHLIPNVAKVQQSDLPCSSRSLCRGMPGSNDKLKSFKINGRTYHPYLQSALFNKPVALKTIKPCEKSAVQVIKVSKSVLDKSYGYFDLSNYDKSSGKGSGHEDHALNGFMEPKNFTSCFEACQNINASEASNISAMLQNDNLKDFLQNHPKINQEVIAQSLSKSSHVNSQLVESKSVDNDQPEEDEIPVFLSRSRNVQKGFGSLVHQQQSILAASSKNDPDVAKKINQSFVKILEKINTANSETANKMFVPPASTINDSSSPSFIGIKHQKFDEHVAGRNNNTLTNYKMPISKRRRFTSPLLLLPPPIPRSPTPTQDDECFRRIE
uniref:Uncharacterized protein n=1 Tax=Panagrolaimus sp. ES5 TaxID=591445 RepID=A0AC34FHQ1_9BILA